MKNFIRAFFHLNPRSITFFMTIVVLVLFFIGIPIFDIIELKSYDLRFRSRGMKKATPEIAIAVIDEKSLDTIGTWPWPRKEFGRLIEILSEDGAKVIGFDIGFWEPDDNSDLQILDNLEKKIESFPSNKESIINFIEESRKELNNDLIFAESLKKSRADVVLGHFFHMSVASLGYEISDEIIEERKDRISSSKYPLIRYEDPQLDIGMFLPDLTAFVPESNLRVLCEAADSSGYFNMIPDYDGIIRSMPMVIKCGQDIYSPLSIQTVWHYLDKPQLMLKVALYGIEGIRLGDKFIPTDESGRMLINYRGPERTYPHYSISDIMAKNIPEGTFKDRIVLVGGTAIGLGDIRFTSVSSSGEYPGIEVHANVIDNILNNQFMNKPKWATIYDFLQIILMGILIGIIVPRAGAVKGLLFVLLLFVLHILGVNWLFSKYGYWINMVYPALTLFILYISLTTYHYLVEEKSSRFLHSTFSSYLSPELIEQMVDSKTMPELGGEARDMTAYFTDIQSFSVFSEKLTAAQLVELLNEYLTAMTDILIAEGGTLDKYEGDAIIAFFGAPLNIPDHPLRACRTAVGMQNALIDLRRKWKQERHASGETDRNSKKLPAEEWAPGNKWPKVVHNMKMRIGINSGDIVVGNMGSSMRMNYTMMGDSVNLAARLEAGAKQFGIYTAVSEYALNLEYINEKGVKERAMDMVEARFIDNITVVGKSEPVKIYELCAMKGELSEQEEELFRLFGKGLGYYQKMEWDMALEYFNKALKVERIPDGNTTPSAVFIERCEMFKENPPVPSGQKWNCVFRMTEK